MLTTQPNFDARCRRDCACRRARHRHGTRGAYNRDGCRCDPCTVANAATARRHRFERAQQRWHGTSAWSHPAGTRRRLQALTAAGWSTSQLADGLGVTKSAIAHLRCTGQDRVLARTAADVAALYEACWWRTPPGRYQARAERYAESRGWLPPWRWDGVNLDDPTATALADDPADDVDQVAVAEAIAGRRVPLTSAERAAVEIQLETQGKSAREIGLQLDIAPRTVQRHRAARPAAA